MAVDKYEDVIPKGMTKFRLVFKTKVNLNDNPLAVNGAKFVYRDPDGNVSEWQAYVLSGYESSGKIYVDFSAVTKCDAEGVWKFWSKLNFLDGLTATAKRPVAFLCVSEGDVIN